MNTFSNFNFIFNLLRKLISLWVKPTIDGLENLQDLDSTPVCYVLSQRSLSDLLILDEQCKKANLPRPSRSINLTGGNEKHAYFCLSRSEGLILQRERKLTANRLNRLISWVEADNSRDVKVIPVSFFWGKSPDKEESALKLFFAYNYSVGGKFRKFFTTLLLGRQTLLHFNQPMSLRELVDEGLEHNRTARKANRVLRVHFRHQRATVVGPDLSHRRTLVNGLIKTPVVQAAIAKEVANSGLDTFEIEGRALHYANEIASDFTMSAIRFVETLLTWFWNKFYQGIETHNLPIIKEYAQRGHTIIYVPCHRSHIDYLLISYLVHHNGLTPPHIAAGINLNMPIVGGILRRCGAFFMRRSFRDNALYTTVFNEYLHTLFTRGFPVEYFVEGGRSRTGRTLKPKTGMLAITLRSFLRDQRRPITFIPIYIGYERVLEGGTYLGELKGKSKKKESPLDILRTLRGLKNSFGKVRVNVGKPIELEKFLEKNRPNWKDDAGLKDKSPAWLSATTNALATRIACHINGASAINPVNLIAMVLLSTRNQALGQEALISQLDCYLRLLDQVPYAPYISKPDLDAPTLVNYVENLGLIQRRSDSLGDIIYLEGNNAILMTYYRNNILHLFAIPSLLANYFVNEDKASKLELINYSTLLYPYLSAELFLHYESEELSDLVSSWLDAMVEQGLLVADNDDYYRPDSLSSKFIELNLLAKAIVQTLERFYITTSILTGTEQPMTSEELENKSRDLAQRLSIINGLNAPEFFDKSLFKNFIAALQQKQLVTKQQDGTLSCSDELNDITLQTRQVLSADVRHSIVQVALGNQ